MARIAFDLRVNDPAYVSRFLAARAGMGPAAYGKRGQAKGRRSASHDGLETGEDGLPPDQ